MEFRIFQDFSTTDAINNNNNTPFVNMTSQTWIDGCTQFPYISKYVFGPDGKNDSTANKFNRTWQ